MIKAEVNKGNVDIIEAEGNGLVLMSELCCMVKAVCTAYFEDEEHSKEMTRRMVLAVADALKVGEESMQADKCEDDENADF